MQNCSDIRSCWNYTEEEQATAVLYEQNPKFKGVLALDVEMRLENSNAAPSALCAMLGSACSLTLANSLLKLGPGCWV